jgi:hypothetical protein
MRIGPSDLELIGLVVGCWPINGLRMSTLECFFSSSCINTILRYLYYFTEMDGSPPINFTLPQVLPFTVNPLNSSLPSRFAPNTTIGILLDALFIEQWTNTTSYENYYDACEPTLCRYEYVARNDAVYVITSILSLYGGLIVSLRFIVWNISRLYERAKRHFPNRRTPVQPFITQN